MLINATFTMLRNPAFIRLQRIRLHAFYNFMYSRLCSRSGPLESLDSVIPPAHDHRYAGLQDVSLKRITGSVDRRGDFDRNFHPLKFHLWRRWINVYLLAMLGRWSPVRLYQVGEQYFVGDGHHRVSVAHALGCPSIQAEVWQFQATPA